MPAINISGGNGLQSAIEALTSAINRANSLGNGGPPGGGGGGAGGGAGGGGGGRGNSIFGTRSQRADARWLDADYNARRQYQRTATNYQRAEAGWQNQDFELRKRLRDRKLRDERTEAGWENQDFDTRKRAHDRQLRDQRTEAGWENQEFDARRRTRDRHARDQRIEAGWENQEFDARRRTRDRLARGERIEATWENQDFDARKRTREKELRDQRTEANWHDQDFNKRFQAAKRQADQAYRLMRADADYMNRKFDRAKAGGASLTSDVESARYRLMRGEADHFNRLHERNAAAQYRAMRADADEMNRQFDRKNRPTSNRGYGSNPRNSLQAIAGLFNGRATLAEAALVLGKDVIQSPFIAANWANKAMSLSKPYNDLRLGTSALGIGGNFNSYDLQDILYPGGQGSGNGPGGQPAPAWMKQYGLAPMDAMGILGKFGITGTSGAQNQRIVQSIAGANYMPYLGGLGYDQYAKSGALATTLGLTEGSRVTDRKAGYGSAPDVDNMSGYFRELQKVTAAAVSMGLDRSQSIGNVESLLRLQASTNSATLGGGQGMMDYWNRMALSGLSSMRTGQGQLSTLGQMNNAVGGIGLGGNALQSVMVQRYMQKNIKGGLPTTPADVIKIIGQQAYDAAMQPGNTVGQRMVANVMAASKTGSSAFVMDALIPLLQNNPSAWENIANGSGLVTSGNSYLTDKSRAGGMGIDYPSSIAFGVTGGMTPLTSFKGAVPNSLSVDDALKDVPPALRPMLEKAALATGVPVELLASIAKQESTFRQVGSDGKTLKSSAGALGVMGLLPGTAKDLHVDPTDPEQNIMGGARYFAQMLSRTGGDYAKALALYNEGPGHFADVMKGNLGNDETRAYVPSVLGGWGRRNPNMNPMIQAAIANTGQANVGAGEYASNNLMPLVGGKVGDDILRFTGAVNDASTALRHFIDALMHGVNMGHGARSPGMFDLPQIFGGPNPVNRDWGALNALPNNADDAIRKP